MARSRHSIEQKLSALRMMEAETYTWKEIEEAHHVTKDTLRVWKVKSNNNGLVFQTMMPAITGLRAGASPMIHSDRGYQYTSRGFKRMVEDAGLTHSMSRVGRCLDNAPIKGFWGTLKVEMHYLREFQAYSELTSAIETTYLYTTTIVSRND